MEAFEEILKVIDDFVWGPVMLVLLVGTGIFLTFRLKFLTWKNLPLRDQADIEQGGQNEKRRRRRIAVCGSDNGACGNDRYGKYYRGCDSYGIRRRGSVGMDVDLRLFWADLKVQRMYAGDQIP